MARGKIACLRCRSLKHKCDFKYPRCTRCQKMNAECMVKDPVARVLRPRSEYPSEMDNSNISTIDRLQKRVKRLESLLESIGVQIDDPPTTILNLGDMAMLSMIPFKGTASPKVNEIARTSIFGDIDPQEEENITEISLPEKSDECNDIIADYYRLAWIQNPLVEHRESLYGLSHRHYRGDTLSTWDSFLLHMCLAIGLAITGKSNNSIRRHYYTAVRHLKQFYRSIPILLQNNDDDVNIWLQMRSIQSLLLVCSFGLLQPVSPGIGYMITTAMRLCIDLNLHEEEVLRKLGNDFYRRLFWSCYALDRQICCYVNKPFSLEDVNISSKMIEPRGSLGVPYLFTKSRKMQSMIHLFIYKHATSSMIPADQWRQGMHVELNNWLAEVLSSQQSPDEELQSAVSTSKDFLVLTYFQLVHSLYRPSAVRIVTMTGQQYQILFECAKCIIGIYEKLNESNRINYKSLSVYSIYQSGLTIMYCLINCPDLSYESGTLLYCEQFMGRITKILRNCEKDCPAAANIERTLLNIYPLALDSVKRRLTSDSAEDHHNGASNTYGPFDTLVEKNLDTIGAIPLLRSSSNASNASFQSYRDDESVSAQILKALNFQDLNLPPNVGLEAPSPEIQTEDLWEFLYEEPFNLKGVIL